MSKEGIRRSKFEHGLARLVADKTGRESADMKRDRLEATANWILRRNKKSLQLRDPGPEASAPVIEGKPSKLKALAAAGNPWAIRTLREKQARGRAAHLRGAELRCAKAAKTRKRRETKDEVSMSKHQRPMYVSDDEIWAKRTEKAKRAGIGAWSAKQLAAWGVPWPPPKGWRRKLNGGVYGARENEPVVTRARARLDREPDDDDDPPFQENIVTEVLGESDDDQPPWN
jgi:hypothetical protein